MCPPPVKLEQKKVQWLPGWIITSKWEVILPWIPRSALGCLTWRSSGKAGCCLTACFLCGCHLEEDSCVLCIGEEVKVKRTPLYFKNELPPQNASQLPNINIEEANSSNYSHSIWCHEVNLFSVFDLLSPGSKTRLFLECFLSFFWRNRSMVTFIVHTHQHSSESWTPIPMMMQLVANNLRSIHS